jgi:hypothetical protein
VLELKSRSVEQSEERNELALRVPTSCWAGGGSGREIYSSRAVALN